MHRKLGVVAFLLAALALATPAIAGPSGSRFASFKVVQFNVRFDFESDRGAGNAWANRAALVAGLVKDSKATVVCFQEDKLDQVEDLKKLMPGWEFVGQGRDGRASERCSVAFDTSVWKALDSGDFWLSDTPDKVGSNTWGTKYAHKVTWATLENVKDPKRRSCTFLSTHLDEHDRADEVRIRSVKVIRKWIAEHVKPGQNVCVCGDFNAGTNEEAHAVMVDGSSHPALKDAWETVKPNDPNTGTVHNFTGKSFKKMDDWILTGGGLVPLDIKIDRWNKNGRYPSDHFAVVAEIDLGAVRKPAKPAAKEPVEPQVK